MITGENVYDVLSAVVPLYVAMALAYGSVRWWKIFTDDQCSGINRYVAVFAIPFLCFHVISSTNVYAMNLRFIAADSLQKVAILVALFLWQCLSKHGDLGWTITLFSLATLPNTLIIGLPLLEAMYGDFSENLLIQIVVLQSLIWYTLLLFLFEYRAAKALLSENVPPVLTPFITSFRVDPDVSSLGGSEPLQAETEVVWDGKVRVVIKSFASMDSRAPTSLRGIQLHSLQSASPAEATPRASFAVSVSTEGLYACSEAANSTRNERGIWEMQTKDGRKSSSCNTPSAEPNLLAQKIDADVGTGEQGDGHCCHLPSGVMARLILTMVWRKLIRNPNTYASIIGLIWSLVSLRWNIEMPKMVKGSISILSDTGLGMAMFSLGLFMASQPSIVACGKSIAALVMALRFLLGPAVMAAASAAIGIRRDLLRAAIVQAALPGGIVPFVFAREYNCHADMQSTSVAFGMLVALPVTMLYYVLLGL